MIQSVTTSYLYLLYFVAFCVPSLRALQPQMNSKNDITYDFIVIGGGTAGLPVASRLSQYLPDCSVLVIEAGPAAPNEPKINIPALRGSTLGTLYDWNFTTTPQSHAEYRSFTQNRGKVLGGSSALNLLAWDRGSKADYDSWEKLDNPGWNWHTMIKAMLKSENFFRANGTYEHYDDSEGGVINSLVNRYVPAQQEYFFPVMESFGIKLNLDPMGGDPTGVWHGPTSIREVDYKRSYSAFNPGYPSVAGPGLVIMTNSTVQKIDCQCSNGTLIAIGVQLKNGTYIKAAKEVILSAGSLQSPGLLEVSGIGNSSVLSASNVSTLLDLPGVGDNLQDHLRVQTSYQLRPNYTSIDILRYNTTYEAEQLKLYDEDQLSRYDYGGNPYAFLEWARALGNASASRLLSLAQQAASKPSTIRSRILLSYLEEPTLNVPQLEVIFSDGYTGVKGYPSVNSSLYGADFFTVLTAIQHPFSIGSVHINTSSIASSPVINPNYLSHEYDVQALVEAAKYARKVASTYPLSQAWISEYEPGFSGIPGGPASYESKTYDDLWRQFVLNTSMTVYHPVGTCSMLPKSDGGVVDPELRVYGTSNLRVVDASVIPLLLSGHMQTAVYGIAERAAEMIVETWT